MLLVSTRTCRRWFGAFSAVQPTSVLCSASGVKLSPATDAKRVSALCKIYNSLTMLSDQGPLIALIKVPIDAVTVRVPVHHRRHRADMTVQYGEKTRKSRSNRPIKLKSKKVSTVVLRVEGVLLQHKIGSAESRRQQRSDCNFSGGGAGSVQECTNNIIDTKTR